METEPKFYQTGCQKCHETGQYCGWCNGSGFNNDDKLSDCPSCAGTGYLCGWCNGTGAGTGPYGRRFRPTIEYCSCKKRDDLSYCNKCACVEITSARIFDKCVWCNGTGHAHGPKCNICRGYGHLKVYEILCSECNGKPPKECPKCDKGMTLWGKSCQYCFGVGFIVCSKCNSRYRLDTGFYKLPSKNGL